MLAGSFKKNSSVKMFKMWKIGKKVIPRRY